MRGWHALGLAVAIGACQDAAPRRRATPTPADAAGPSVADLIRIARYHSIDEILADAEHAARQIAVVPVTRASVRDKDFTAYPCPALPAGHRYFLTIPPGGDDLVRAMPRNAAPEACARAVVRVMNVQSGGFTGYRADDGSWQTAVDADRIVEAETLDILNVEPRSATPAPAGVDFVSLVDLALARRPGGGVIVELSLRPIHGLVGDGVLMATCDDTGDVYFPGETATGKLATLDGCHPVRFTTRPRDDFRMSDEITEHADVLEIR